MTSRSDIRRSMRAGRRAVASRQRRAAGLALMHAATRLPMWRWARRVAIYRPADGEIDTTPLAREARRHGKELYLPVVDGHKLRFRRWQPRQGMARNRFGIPEPPRSAPECPTRWLDLVVMPLVAFDGAGNRLGMGGGFYDHTLAFRHRHPRWRHPRLVGAAFALQQVAALPTRPWDVPLDAVITERGVVRTQLRTKGEPA
jgi:5-formyltetrahydrofolate cyclo-ligase